MKTVAFVLALLCIPAVASAESVRIINGRRCVYRGGCWVYAPVAKVVTPAYVAPVSKTAAELATGLAQWAADNRLVSEAIASVAGGPGVYGSYSYANRGNTQYGYGQQGYSLQSYSVSTPTPLDADAALERAFRLGQQQIEAAKQGQETHAALSAQFQANELARAKALVAASMARDILNAPSPEVQATVQVQATASTTSGDAAVLPEAPIATAQVLPSLEARFASVVATNCVSCHKPGGSGVNSGDFTNVAALDKATLTRMRDAVMSGRMPKSLDASKPAAQLSADAKLAFWEAEAAK